MGKDEIHFDAHAYATLHVGVAIVLASNCSLVALCQIKSSDRQSAMNFPG